MTKSVKVSYYAILREQSGLNEETVSTDARTASELFEQLRKSHSFSVTSKNFKVAINDDIVGYDSPINSGDEIVFIPPVAGG